jgi:hypothetical protein
MHRGYHMRRFIGVCLLGMAIMYIIGVLVAMVG